MSNIIQTDSTLLINFETFLFCNVKPSIDNYVQDPVLRNAPDLGDVEDGIEANSEQKLNSEEEILKAGKGSYFTMKIIIFADKFL